MNLEKFLFCAQKASKYRSLHIKCYSLLPVPPSLFPIASSLFPFLSRLNLQINIMVLLETSSENSAEIVGNSLNPPVSTTSKQKTEAGLASLLLTIIELLRQLMEAQVIRQMEQQLLSETELDEAAESLQKLEEQVLELCEIFDIDPADLNVHLGEFGTLLPAPGTYYPGETSNHPSILELLDRLLNTGIVVYGDVDLGLASLDLIHAKLRLVLTSKPI